MTHIYNDNYSLLWSIYSYTSCTNEVSVAIDTWTTDGHRYERIVNLNYHIMKASCNVTCILTFPPNSAPESASDTLTFAIGFWHKCRALSRNPRQAEATENTFLAATGNIVTAASQTPLHVRHVVLTIISTTTRLIVSIRKSCVPFCLTWLSRCRLLTLALPVLVCYHWSNIVTWIPTNQSDVRMSNPVFVLHCRSCSFHWGTRRPFWASLRWYIYYFIVFIRRRFNGIVLDGWGH